MRRLVALLLVGSVAALAGRRAVWMGAPKPVTGMSNTRMAFARWGTGTKTLLLMPGGPGNFAPGGISLWMMLRPFRRLLDEGYSIWWVTRKQRMPQGHSIADMADDYAEFIESELGGRVDVALGTSYGGIIGFYLAARHPERFRHIVTALAGYAVSERGKRIDYTFAQRLSQGRAVEAARGMFEDYFPQVRIPGLARLFGEVMGRIGFRGGHPGWASDLMVEAEAEVAFDARPVLPQIRVPVLLIGGGADYMFPEGYLEETAGLIPDCTVRVYEGRDHMGAISDERFCPDILEFIAKN
jgi:pimeloyl-ACP methyl ester carboxylesterase